MRLYEQLSEPGFHTTVITTFGIDFPAYEDLALSKLRSSGCKNNIVVVDSRMLTYALSGASAPPRAAGRQYCVVGATPRGVFHPKVILQIGRDKGRVFISSANMTSSGLAGNLEVTSVLSCGVDQDGDQDLLVSVWEYIQDLLDEDDLALRHQLRWMRAHTPWLPKTKSVDQLLTLSDNTTGMLVRADSESAMSERFVDQIGNEKVQHLVVLSPYWDEQLTALKYIVNALSPQKTSLLVQRSRSIFPKSAAEDMSDVDIYDMDLFSNNEGRFVHAKILVAQTENADHVLFGSANCTLAALGRPNNPGINEEASLYRCLPKGQLMESLRLSTFINPKNKVSIESLPDYLKSESIPLKDLHASNPGRFFCDFTQFRWRPSNQCEPDGAIIQLFDQQRAKLSGELFPIEGSHGTDVLFDLRGFSDRPFFAAVTFPNGTTSPLSIVDLLDSFRNEATEAKSKEIDRLNSKLVQGNFEGLWILEVLEDLEKIEQSQSPDSLIAKAKRSKREIENADDKLHSKLGYDDFVRGRRARDVQDNISRNSLAGTQVSAVRECINRFLRISDLEKFDDQGNEQKILNLFDTGDDTQNPEEFINSGGPDKSSFTSKQKELSLEEQAKIAKINRRKQKKSTIHSLEDAVTRFLERIKSRSDSAELNSTDMLRLRALLTIIIACGYASDESDASKPAERLLRVDSTDDTWLRMIGRVLFSLFGGTSPAILRLQIENTYDDIPDDLLECWAACLWASACCLALTSKHKSLAKSQTSFRKLTSKIQIYTDTGISQASKDGIKSVMQKMSEQYGSRLGVGHSEVHILPPQEKD
jgi:hypothetical protein